MALSDRVAVMRNGVVVELAPPRDLYLRPRTVFAARFVGQADLFACTVAAREAGFTWLDTPLGRVASEGAAPDAGLLSLLIRPEHVDVVAPGTEGANMVDGTIRRVIFSGRLVEYVVALHGGVQLRVQGTSGTLLEDGAPIRLHLPPARCVVVQGDPEEAA